MTYTIKTCNSIDNEYPKAFLELKGMPKLIYYKGDISILNSNKSVAIIGSRNCSEEALCFSREAGRQAAEMGIVVVNGLALGCDTAAILGALDVGGKCAAILPGGLNQIAPKSNEELAEKILDLGGCLLTEYEPDAVPKKYTYVQRDRLQSALSQGVFVVETKIDGGTMHTVEAARKQNRKIAAYVERLTMNTGNKMIIDQGNTAVANLEDLRDYFISLGEEIGYEQLSFF